MAFSSRSELYFVLSSRQTVFPLRSRKRRAQGLILRASNTASPSPIMSSRRGPDYSDEAFKAAAQTHVNYMDERSIDVQIIGPRPFTMLGWMEPHLPPPWRRAPQPLHPRAGALRQGAGDGRRLRHA